jgi:hypothetical protein
MAGTLAAGGTTGPCAGAPRRQTLVVDGGCTFVTGLTPGAADGAAFQPATGWLLAADATTGQTSGSSPTGRP